MTHLYVHSLLGLNLITVFLLLMRKLVGDRLNKKFVYGLWLVVPIFLLTFPFISSPLHFNWNTGITSAYSTLSEAFQTEDTDRKEWLQNEAEGTWQQEDTTVVMQQVENDKAGKQIAENDEAGKKMEGNQIESENLTGKQYRNAETVNTEMEYENNFQTQSKGMKFQVIMEIVYLSIVGILLIGIITANLQFMISCKKKRKYLFKSEGAGLPVYHLDGIASPFLIGKTIYLPSFMVEDVQIRYAILHEESHYKHRDGLWVILRYFVLVVYFYDPVIWMAFYASGRDCELACDEEVLGQICEEERKDYGACLLSIVERRQHMNNRIVLSTNMSTGKKFMKERILNIMDRKKKSHLAMMLTVILMVVITGCAYENNNAGKKPGNLTEKELKQIGEWASPEIFSRRYPVGNRYGDRRVL